MVGRSRVELKFSKCKARMFSIRTPVSFCVGPSHRDLTSVPAGLTHSGTVCIRECEKGSLSLPLGVRGGTGGPTEGVG